MKKNQKKTIKNKELAHHDHFDFLDEIEKVSLKGFDFVMASAMREILTRVRGTTLKKTDDLKRGWSGQVPKVEVDFEGIFEEVMGRYLEALKWILLGDSVGKDAAAVAKEIGLTEQVIPGLVPAAYLNSLDTHRQHFEDIFNKEAPFVKKDMVSESIDNINKRTGRFINQSLEKFKNQLIEAAENVQNQTNDQNIAMVHEHAHDLISSGTPKAEAMADAIEAVTSDEIAMPQLSRALQDAIGNYRKDWQLVTRVDTSLASAVGTHQAMAEVFGPSDDELKIAWYAFRDEKTCKFCKEASRNRDGSFKLYGLKDFEPAGTNYSKKRDNWTLCVPPGHFQCRCSLIYVPPGFDIDNNGNLVPRSKK